jgi:hypothetical protein
VPEHERAHRDDRDSQHLVEMDPMSSRQRDEDRVPAIRTERDHDGTDKDRQDCEHPPQRNRRVVDARLTRRIRMDASSGSRFANPRIAYVGEIRTAASCTSYGREPDAYSPQQRRERRPPSSVDLHLDDVASIISCAQRSSLLSVQAGRWAAIHRGPLSPPGNEAGDLRLHQGMARAERRCVIGVEPD